MGGLSFIQFLREQWTRMPEVGSFKADLTGRTVIITGGNAGLGFEAAKHLARMSLGKLILACRNQEKGDAAVQANIKDTGCENVECWQVDLASFASVSQFADRFEREGGGRLDILIENAGMSTMTYAKTVDGWEVTLGVNHLGTSLLALRLLPSLLKAPALPPTPRIVIVTSELHYWIDFKEMDASNILERLSEPEYADKLGHQGRYARTKLFNVLLARALTSRLPATTSLTVNAVNPGLCHTSFMSDQVNYVFTAVKAVLARTAEVGSRTLVHAAVAPELQGQSGQYLSLCHVAEPSELAMGRQCGDVETRIWNETIEVLSKADPRVPEIVREYLS